MSNNLKRPYTKIRQEIRDKIIHDYFKKNLSFMEISIRLNVNLSTIKSIIKIYKLEGRSFAMISKPRKIKSINFHSKVIKLHKQLASKQEMPPKSFFQSYVNKPQNLTQATAFYKNIPFSKDACNNFSEHQNSQVEKISQQSSADSEMHEIARTANSRAENQNQSDKNQIRNQKLIMPAQKRQNNTIANQASQPQLLYQSDGLNPLNYFQEVRLHSYLNQFMKTSNGIQNIGQQ